jgi:predicted metal-dependent hydrolase
LKRHSRPETFAPTETSRVPDPQLSLPFSGRKPAQPAPDAAVAARPSTPRERDIDSQSRRDFRPEEAARQVRLSRSPVDEADRVAVALALYLPPGKTLELALTNNHYSMISVRRKSDGYRLRLHRMFVDAEARIVRALARYVVHNDRRASTLLGEYIEEHQHIIRQQERRPRHLKLRTVGRHHDLQAIYDRLNVQLFAGALEARITWGPGTGTARRRRSIKMGSFAVEDRVIRIHPALDQDHVPDFFVEWIVFHEMLHGKHEVLRTNGRRRFHTPEFLAEERTFPEYARACAWEKANLDRLLRS